ncbi:MAG: M28 family peptidase [Gemmatimonadaceae bacterium]|nr:M28 family peptidase [Gemmatimonadaceae bacterium]
MRSTSSLLATLLVVAPLTLAAQQRSVTTITPAEIDGQLRFLASDLLEGRAPGTRGGRIAAEYIASELRAIGVEPAGDSGSYFQRVPIDIVGADPATIRLGVGMTMPSSANTGGPAVAPRSLPKLRYPEDVVLWAGSATENSSANGEIVFVGYGAKAPEYKWDDFKGTDLKGKILLVLVNDPPAPANEPTLFGGKAMTYYGRWTYKFEEAERQGAAGMLIVHTTEQAGYPWHTVVGSWAKEQRMLPRDASLPAPLGFRGWITDSAATALLAQAGLDLAKLRAQADSRDFKPVATGLMLTASFHNTVQHLSSENVVGRVSGRDPKARNEYVVLSAHWDHLGIGPAVNGDSIYNGASDNASGVADLLAVAHAATQGAKPRRSLLFAFVTAEESGLLGSDWFATHPPVPAKQIVADINLDGGNILGRTRDVTVLGENKSTLGSTIAAMIRPQGMKISPEDHPERGHFYRSDHFSFAKAGIPAVSIGSGNDYVDHPAGWGALQEEDYTEHRYHQPSDEYKPGLDLSGAAQLSQLVYRLAIKLGNDTAWPAWAKDAEFKR